MGINIISMFSASAEYGIYKQLLRDEQYVREEIKNSVERKISMKREIDMLIDNIKTIKKHGLTDAVKLDELKELLKAKQFNIKDEVRSLSQKYGDLETAKKQRKNKWSELLRNESFIHLAGTNSIEKYLLKI